MFLPRLIVQILYTPFYELVSFYDRRCETETGADAYLGRDPVPVPLQTSSWRGCRGWAKLGVRFDLAGRSLSSVQPLTIVPPFIDQSQVASKRMELRIFTARSICEISSRLFWSARQTLLGPVGGGEVRVVKGASCAVLEFHEAE